MAELDRLEVRLEANISQFRSELQKAERAAQSATTNMGRQFATLNRAVEPVEKSLGSLRQAATLFEESARSMGPGRQLADLSSAARGLGSVFASAFEDAAVGGRKLSGVLRGLQADILRVLTRQLVTQPLTNVFAGLLGGAAAGLPRYRCACWAMGHVAHGGLYARAFLRAGALPFSVCIMRRRPLAFPRW